MAALRDFHPEECKVKEIISAEAMQKRVKEVAAEIDAYYAALGAKEILLVGVLKGAITFQADLLRELKTTTHIDFIQVSSYIGTSSSGELTIHKDLDRDISGVHVLLAEDIVDSGFTLSMLMERLAKRNPASLHLCAACDKVEARRYPVKVDFAGFEVPDKFLVGYGLDCEEYFRGLPYVGELILP
jgi:hypoxanthine phosphoribosyltransferase